MDADFRYVGSRNLKMFKIGYLIVCYWSFNEHLCLRLEQVVSYCEQLPHYFVTGRNELYFYLSY